VDINRRAKLKGKQRKSIDLSDPTSWETHNFPSHSKFLVGTPAFTPNAFKNRTNMNVYHVFRELFGRHDLWCNIDNWGFFRPTKNIAFPDGVKDRDDWRYNLKLHWDFNPWILKKWDEVDHDPTCYQGLVALVNCPEEVGGFACVPCSHIFLKKWTEERPCPRMDKASMRIPADDPMQNYIQHVPLRKGELVIWTSSLVHANFPNTSNKWRIHQFIRMLPADRKSNDKDRYAPLRIMNKFRDDPFVRFGPEDFPYLSPLQRKLIGIDFWEEKDRPSFWEKSMEMHPYPDARTGEEEEEGEEY